MVDERERAVVKKAATFGAHPPKTAGRTPKRYVVEAQVFDECWDDESTPRPEPEPDEGGAVEARLERIEKQLAQVIALLERR